MVEQPDRYCGNCGHELRVDDRFCPGCGRATHQTARVPTPDADVPVPPPPQQGVGAPSPLQQVGSRSGWGRRLGIGLLGCLGVFVVLVIIAVVIVSGLSGKSDKNESANQPSGHSHQKKQKQAAKHPQSKPEKQHSDAKQSQAQHPNGPTAKIGETVSVGDAKWLVTDARRASELTSDFAPTKRGNFVVVGFEFTNKSNEAVTLDSSSLSLLDDQGRKSEADPDDFGYVPQKKEIFLNQVNPGVTQEGEVIYSVAPDASGFTLQAGDLKIFSDKNAYIDLGKLSSSGANASGAKPSSVTASSTTPPAPDAAGNMISYDPENVVDGQNSTAWNVDGDGVGQSITLNYDKPVTVDRIGIIPGYDKVDPTDGTHRFYQLYVIKKAQIDLSDGTSVKASFSRDPSMQFTDVPNTTTDSVKVTILDTYPPGNSPYGDNYPYLLYKAAISEISVKGP